MKTGFFTFLFAAIISALSAQSKITIQAEASWKTTANPEPGWEQPGFNDATWLPAASPSPGLCGPSSASMWHPEGPSTAWFRKEFFVPDNIYSIDYRTFGVDDDADVYINGILVISNSDCSATDLGLTNLQSYLKKGNNTIAIKATNCGGCYGVSIDFDINTSACSIGKPVITSSGVTSDLCPGTKITLKTSAAYSSYLWNTGETTRAIAINSANSYAVTVTDENGCSATSDPTTVTYTGCADPTSLAFDNLTGTSAVLSWTGMPCAIKYTIQYRIAGTTTWNQVTATTPSLLLTGLTDATQYQWNVTAVCGGGTKSAKITGPKFTTASNAQNKITIQADASWKTSVNPGPGWEQPGFNDASWIAAASPSPGLCAPWDATMWHPDGPSTAWFRKEFFIPDNIYSIDYRTFGVDDDADVYINGILVISNNDCSATDLGLTNLQFYLKKGNNTIAIKATDCGGCYAVVIDFDINTSPCSLEKPVITSASNTSDLCPGTKITLKTSAAYSSYLWNTNETTRMISVGSANSYTVTVTDSKGCAATSDPTVVTYTGCGDPTNLAASSITTTSATLSWTGSPCATKYTIQYRKVGTTTWTKVTATTPSLAVTGLSAGTQYQWNVTGVCGGGTKSAKITAPKFTTAAAIASAKAENMQNGEFKATLFPNPAKGRTVLQLSGAKDKVFVMITNITGKPLWQSGGVNDTQIQLPVEKFSNGTYLVHITSGNENKTIKLIKTK